MVDETLLVPLVGATFLLGGVYLLWRFTLRRRAQILAGEVKVPPQDRAFNQIRITRASATHLGSLGYDVSGIQGQLDRAEERYDHREHAAALRIAEVARDQLKLIHSRTAAGSSASAGAEKDDPRAALPATRPPPADPLRAGTVPRSPPVPAPAKLPKGLVEARFTLTLLDQEIERAEGANSTDPRLGEVRNLRSEAKSSFDGKQYPEAWSTALRARRHLGSMVEGVSLGTAPPSAAEPDLDEVPGDAAGVRCPQCGHDLRGNEKFCRACGASLTSHRCPRCNAPVEPQDAYCHACGSPVSG
ncbi:MAG: zinc ribbon domain-containing protein [Thermoplasmata archaeon]|nr:zinc ribbon domain-containing protein [Thermoplasmata archaeon]